MPHFFVSLSHARRIIWVEDPETEHIYHHEHFALHRKQASEEHTLAFTIPVIEPVPPQYYVRAFSERWVGCVPRRAKWSRESSLSFVTCRVDFRCEATCEISMRNCVLPDRRPRNTPLLDLTPLPKSALAHKARTAPLSRALRPITLTAAVLRVAFRGPLQVRALQPDPNAALPHALSHRSQRAPRRADRLWEDARRRTRADAPRAHSARGEGRVHRTAQGEARARAAPRACARFTYASRNPRRARRSHASGCMIGARNLSATRR